MTTYDAIVTITNIVQIEAENEKQAIEKVKAGLPPRTVADVQIAQELKITEE